ncbi:AAA family ATPase (plasmid) [Halorarum halophilum]|uniref:ORC1-type DNA replication protein n=1 Tax=Halorarum halophilum TaxID=2743090 RepID=A0A7D5KGG3_9EURY|nr:AAA family ATPase [Halobaculum halophilum]QLG29777.1 AAA family ATPase [Halobaculum halophilum]
MGSNSIFEDDVEIIRDADLFTEEHTPEEILCRDDVMQNYVNALKPVYKGRPPRNAFLYGDTGVGKTAATKYLLRELESDIRERNADRPADDQRTFTHVRINCQNIAPSDGTASSYQVAIALVNEFRDDQIASTGYASREVYSMLYEELDDIGGTVLIVLDEVDRVGESDTLLYDLPRARDIGYVEDTRIGLIGISNDYTFRSNLSPKVRDTLCETEIKFPAYSADELEEIIAARANNALHDETYDKEVLSLCAALAMRNSSGSARRAMDLLKQAAEHAENVGNMPIQPDDVYAAKEELDYGDMVESIIDQDQHKQLIIDAVARLEADGRTPVRTKAIHAIYEQLASAAGDDPLSQRGMYNHLTRLDMLGFLQSFQNNEGLRGGQYNTYELSEALTVRQVKDAIDSSDLPTNDVELELDNILVRAGLSED